MQRPPFSKAGAHHWEWQEAKGPLSHQSCRPHCPSPLHAPVRTATHYSKHFYSYRLSRWFFGQSDQHHCTQSCEYKQLDCVQQELRMPAEAAWNCGKAYQDVQLNVICGISWGQLEGFWGTPCIVGHQSPVQEYLHNEAHPSRKQLNLPLTAASGQNISHPLSSQMRIRD